MFDTPVLDNMKCSSSFDITVATATGLQFEVSDIFPFLFMHMETIVVSKQELDIYPWTIHMLNSSLRKNT